MPKFLPAKSIADMHFHDGSGYPFYGIAYRYRGMGIRSRVQYNSIIIPKTAFVQFIYDLPLYIGLIIFQLHLLKLKLQTGEILLESSIPIHLWLPFPQKVKIGSVDN